MREVGLCFHFPPDSLYHLSKLLAIKQVSYCPHMAMTKPILVSQPWHILKEQQR